MTLVGLAAKNLLRNKFRAILTVLAVAVAIIAFTMLRTIVFAWTAASDYAAKDRVVTRNKITFVMPLPLRYIEDVRNAPHIKLATFASWFGGKDPKHDKEFFATLAADKTFFDVYTDMAVPKEAMADWLADPQGAIVGDVLAKKMGWNVGDKVILASGIYQKEGDWEFHIKGIYEATARSADRSTFVFRWDYLNNAIPERRRDTIGWIVSRVDDPKHSADTGVLLDKMFEEKEIQTLSQDEHSFTASFLAGISAVLSAVDIVSAVILLIMMLIVGNTIAMGVRERTNEYGVLKALGFSGGRIAFFIIGESVLLGFIGGALGIALAYPLVEKGMGKWLEENMGSFFPYFRVNPIVAAVAVGLAIGLAGLASVIPAYRASKLNVIDALRRVA